MFVRSICLFFLLTSVAGCGSVSCPVGQRLEGGICRVVDAGVDGVDGAADGGADASPDATSDAGMRDNVGAFCGSTTSTEGQCRPGAIACVGNTEVCEGEVPAASSEICGDGVDNDCQNDADDNDCDGFDDEVFDCVRGTSFACNTSCGSAGSGSCNNSCQVVCTAPSESCNYADDDCDGVVDEGVSAFSDDSIISGVVGLPSLVSIQDGFVAEYDQKIQRFDVNGVPNSSPVEIEGSRATLVRQNDGSVAVFRSRPPTDGSGDLMVLEVARLQQQPSSISLGSWTELARESALVISSLSALASADGGAIVFFFKGQSLEPDAGVSAVRITSSLGVAVGPVEILPVQANGWQFTVDFALAGDASNDLIFARSDSGANITISRLNAETFVQVASQGSGTGRFVRLAYADDIGAMGLLSKTSTGKLEHRSFNPQTLSCSGGGVLSSCGTIVSGNLTYPTTGEQEVTLDYSGGRWIAAWTDSLNRFDNSVPITGLQVRIFDRFYSQLATLGDVSFTGGRFAAAYGTEAPVVFLGEKDAGVSTIAFGCF